MWSKLPNTDLSLRKRFAISKEVLSEFVVFRQLSMSIINERLECCCYFIKPLPFKVLSRLYWFLGHYIFKYVNKRCVMKCQLWYQTITDITDKYIYIYIYIYISNHRHVFRPNWASSVWCRISYRSKISYCNGGFDPGSHGWESGILPLH